MLQSALTASRSALLMNTHTHHNHIHEITYRSHANYTTLVTQWSCGETSDTYITRQPAVVHLYLQPAWRYHFNTRWFCFDGFKINLTRLKGIHCSRTYKLFYDNEWKKTEHLSPYYNNNIHQPCIRAALMLSKRHLVYHINQLIRIIQLQLNWPWLMC